MTSKTKRQATEDLDVKLANYHCIAVRHFTLSEIQAIYKQAHLFQKQFEQKQLKRENKRNNLLAGRVVVNLFYENSTRTRSSFELAAKYLGADVVNFDVALSSAKKGETLFDTIETLLAMHIDALVIRHPESGVVEQIAQWVNNRAIVINAGDGCHQHPTQALLDGFTILEQFKCDDLKRKKVTIIGDIKHSRVAHSNIQLLSMLGASVHVVAPPTLLPADIEALGCIAHTDLQAGLLDADAVMSLRIQAERQEAGLIGSLSDYHRHYGLSHDVIQHYCKPSVIVLDPGPVNRGVQITSALADDSQYSLIRKQVTNGIWVRMAILYLNITAREALHE